MVVLNNFKSKVSPRGHFLQYYRIVSFLPILTNDFLFCGLILWKETPWESGWAPSDPSFSLQALPVLFQALYFFFLGMSDFFLI